MLWAKSSEMDNEPNRAPRRFAIRAHASDRIGRRFVLPRERSESRPNGLLRRLVRRFFFTVGLLFLASCIVVLGLRWIDPPTTAFILQDTSGRDPLLYQWVKWTDISDAAPLAVVSAEDQLFTAHYGFDVKSIRDSIEEHGDGAPLRGASTISQQVSKNLFLWSGKSFFRKGLEAYFTVLIEALWSKQRILEVYLNVAEFGPGIYGVRAASETYFGKPPASMIDAEAALMAAVLPNPKRLHIDRPSDYVLERQRWILSQMQRLRREQWLVSFEAGTDK